MSSVLLLLMVSASVEDPGSAGFVIYWLPKSGSGSVILRYGSGALPEDAGKFSGESSMLLFQVLS